MRALKRRLNHKNPNVQLLALGVNNALLISVLDPDSSSSVNRRVCKEWRRSLLSRTGLTGVHG